VAVARNTKGISKVFDARSAPVLSQFSSADWAVLACRAAKEVVGDPTSFMQYDDVPRSLVFYRRLDYRT
jgi:hypothetical protein